MPPKPIRIGLLWHSARSGNLGVGALTVSNLAILREVCGELGLVPTFTIIGGREAGDPYVTGPDVRTVDIDRHFLLSGEWTLLESLDCVVDIGAGDSFSDIYSVPMFGLMWWTKYLALLRRRPLLLSPQTIGPFSRQPWRALAAYIMNRADAVLARDPLSYDLARKLAKKTRTALSVDVAFMLPYSRRERSDRALIEVGINVSGLLFGGGDYADRFGLEVDYTKLMRDLIERLSAREDVSVKLITHVVSEQHPSDDDGRVADRLAAEFPRVERIPNFTSPSDAKSYISGLDLLIGARMHACIAAFSSGVAVVPVAYSRKFDGLFRGMLDYPHSVPVKGWSTGQALDYLTAAVDRRDALRADVEAGMRRVGERLEVYREELRRFLGHAASLAGQ